MIQPLARIPLYITPSAAAEIARLRPDPSLVIRLCIHPDRPLPEKYELAFVARQAQEIDEVCIESESIPVLISGERIQCLAGTTLDYRVEMWRAGFHFDNPNRFAMMGRPELATRVDSVITEIVVPIVRPHKGMVTLVDLLGATAFVEFSGGCKGCSFAPLTLQHLVIGAIRTHVPEVKEVVDATTHSISAETFRMGTAPSYL